MAHPPSQARALAQDAKAGRSTPDLLAHQARSLEDPSFAAEALAALAQDPRLPRYDIVARLQDAATFVARTERDWRRAEAIAAIAQKARQVPPGADLAPFWTSLSALAARLPAGAPRSAAIAELAMAVSPGDRATLLRAAVADPATAVEDAKRLVAADVTDAKAILQASPDPTTRARLLAYYLVHAQAPDWQAAVAACDGLPTADRVDILRGLVAAVEDPAQLRKLHAHIAHAPEERARLLLAMGARADRRKDRPTALAWLAEAEADLQNIPDAKARANVARNLAQAYAKAGDEAAGHRVATGGTAPATEAPRAPASASTDAATGAASPAAAPATRASGLAPPAAKAAGARHILGLYDTYEGGVSEVHLRAIARAAPLCLAFDLDLGLFGFPIRDVRTLVAAAARETNIGEGGAYLEELARDGRIHLVACTTKEPPQDWPRIGFPVATTERPEPTKQVGFEEALGLARRDRAPRIALLMGLGKRGLPASLLKSVPAHLELTGRNLSMETATAMGVMAERLRQVPAV